MARWPKLGQGKSRLAAETSPATAARVQRHSLDRLTHRLRRLPSTQLVIALASSKEYRTAVSHPRFQALPVMIQADGDLGHRMRSLLAQFGELGRPTLIIGSDLPGIRATDISAALDSLRRNDFVLGPADDGGFWLIGWRGGALTKLPSLDGIQWSAKTTRDATAARLSTHGRSRTRVGLIRPAGDIDDRASLKAALADRALSRP
ncbi:MAG: DUF2064 domain-containing protein [Alphaproteobacteria bacterium]|nr:DUF2064 domain-containing protein [Alphaproteobacteria bacterium SS10]